MVGVSDYIGRYFSISLRFIMKSLATPDVSKEVCLLHDCVDGRSCTYDLALMKRPLLLTELHRPFQLRDIFGLSRAYLLREVESNDRLKVMSLTRYHFSIPRYIYYLLHLTTPRP